jgi:hypothetical protein
MIERTMRHLRRATQRVIGAMLQRQDHAASALRGLTGAELRFVAGGGSGTGGGSGI